MAWGTIISVLLKYFVPLLFVLWATQKCLKTAYENGQKDILRKIEKENKKIKKKTDKQVKKIKKGLDKKRKLELPPPTPEMSKEERAVHQKKRLKQFFEHSKL